MPCRSGSSRQDDLGRGPDSLQRLCERCVAVNMVEPRTVLEVLEFADAAGSLALRQHCAGVSPQILSFIISKQALNAESRQYWVKLCLHDTSSESC